MCIVLLIEKRLFKVHIQSDLKNILLRNGTIAPFSIPVSVLFCNFLLVTKYFFFPHLEHRQIPFLCSH